MTDTLLALVPTYGLWLVFGTVVLGCLGFPVPGSVLVLTAGAFAAAENFALWQVLVTTFGAYVVGDQLAFALGRRAGVPLIERAQAWPRVAPLIHRGASLVESRGQGAVFLSHTVLAQIGPYVTYICGANAMAWPRYSAAAVSGAGIWTFAYVMLGYVFAAQLTQIMSFAAYFGVLLIALALVWLLGRHLRRAWRRFA